MWRTLLLKNWKYVVMVVLLAVIAGLYITVKAQGIVLDKKDMELSALKEANIASTETIKNLKTDVTKANSTCSKRLNSKDELIRELQRIDGINSEGGNDGGEGNSPDPVLNMLNSMFSNR